MKITLTGASGRSVDMQGSWLGFRMGTPIIETLKGFPVVGMPIQGEVVSKLRSGVIVSSIRRDGREISLTGSAKASGANRQIESRQLAETISGLWPDGSGLGEIRHQGDDGIVQIAQVQPKPGGTWDIDRKGELRGVIRWALDFLAPDPYIYGPPQQWQLVPVGTGLGLREPLGQPGYLDFGAVTNTQVQIPNGGNSTAWPVFEVRVDDGAGFRLTTGSRSVVFAGMCSRDVPITVDMGGRVLQSGVDRSVMLRVRDWIGIPPGGMETVWLETLQGGAGSAIATVRDTWI